MKYAYYITSFLIVVIQFSTYAQPFDWKYFGGTLNGRDTQFIETTQGNILWGNETGGIYRSTDGGKSWALSNTGLRMDSVKSLRTGNNPGEAWCGTFDGKIYFSADNGATWMYIASAPFPGMQFIYTKTGLFYAWMEDAAEVYKSVDGGEHWSKVYKAIFPYSNALTLAADDSGRIYMGTVQDGIYYSSDEGATWEHTWNYSTRSETILIESDTSVYALTYGGLRRTTDNGTTWLRIPLPEPDTSPQKISGLIPDDSLLYILYNQGQVYTSPDTGNTWTIYGPLGSVQRFSRVGPDTLLALYKREQIALITDSLQTSTPSIVNLRKVFDIVEAQNGDVWATSRPLGKDTAIYISDDSGKIWRKEYLPLAPPYQAKRIVRDRFRNLYALVEKDGGSYVLMKTVGDSSWSVLKYDDTHVAADVAVTMNGDIYVLYTTDNIAHTTDNGITWEYIDHPFTNANGIQSVTLSTFIVSNLDSVAVFAKSGADWSVTIVPKSALGGNEYYNRHSILTAPDGNVYVGGRELYVSKDTCKTWIHLTNKVDTTHMSFSSFTFSLASDSSGRLLVGTSRGLFILPHPDSQFVKLLDILQPYQIKCLTVTQDGRILAGTSGEFYIAQGPKPQIPTSVQSPQHAPASFSLAAPYPNPFTETATVSFTTDGRTEVTLAVYNVLGRRVATLADATFNPGTFALQWDGRSQNGLPLPPGSYYVRLATPAGVQSVRILKIR